MRVTESPNLSGTREELFALANAIAAVIGGSVAIASASPQEPEREAFVRPLTHPLGGPVPRIGAAGESS